MSASEIYCPSPDWFSFFMMRLNFLCSSRIFITAKALARNTTAILIQMFMSFSSEPFDFDKR